MTRRGRPLRFLAITLGGWTAGRAYFLWQAALLAGAVLSVPVARVAVNPAAAFDLPIAVRAPFVRPAIAPWPLPVDRGAVGRPAPSAETAGAVPPLQRHGVALALAALVRYGREQSPDEARGSVPPPLRPTPLATGRSRLAGSAWAIVRGGGANGMGGSTGGSLLGGQLGASQAGARLTYALGPETGGARRLALSARVATPLHGAGREAAVGLDWQPTKAPLHLLAEQRFSLDGGHGGPTLLVIGGLNPTPVIAGFRLEAYAQAGAIARPASQGGVEAFGDGAARLTHRVAMLGAVRLDAGAGGWGAAQRGARRLDIGPTLGLVVPVSTKALRLTLDWRERIAGEARPGSGPALSVGTDF